MKKQKNLSPGKIVLTILFVLLTLSFFFAVFQAIRSIREVDYSLDYFTEEYYLTCLQHKDYTELARISNRDQKLQDENSETIRQCQAAGFYYEAAVLRQAFAEAGMEEESSRQEALMEKYAEEMGDLEEYTQDILTYVETMNTSKSLSSEVDPEAEES